uniref:Uncharacterized protein n=1 Tax=Romanomermis culicivorax TaxID=13658 RepID=A0A915HN55_ROMCU
MSPLADFISAAMYPSSASDIHTFFLLSYFLVWSFEEKKFVNLQPYQMAKFSGYIAMACIV